MTLRFAVYRPHPTWLMTLAVVVFGGGSLAFSGCAEPSGSFDTKRTNVTPADDPRSAPSNSGSDPPSENTARQARSATAFVDAQDPYGKIESVPLNGRSPSEGAPLFETLDPKEIGIDFFHEKSKSPLVSPELLIGSGVAMGDYDDDGLVDVFLPSSSTGGRLYRNLGDFRFEEITKKAGIASGKECWTTGATFVDIDNDGDLDLYVCGHSCPNLLYINQGDGTFVERAHDFGIDSLRASVMMAFADYDRDGDLDAYLVTNHSPPTSEVSYNIEYDKLGAPRVPKQYLEYRDMIRIADRSYKIIEAGQYDHLYLNNGDGTFSDVSEAAGIRGDRVKIRGNDRGLSATWWDYNGDGWSDLYVANDFSGSDRLYRNNCDGTFTDVIAAAIPHTPWFSMGSDFGDINNDGRFDFMGTDMSEDTDYRQKMTRRNPEASNWFLELPVPRQYMRNAVYVNTGAERFQEIAYLTGMESTNWTWSVRFVDLDQDGRLDAHITNGMSLDLDNSDLKNDALRVGPVDSEAYRRFWESQAMLRQRNFAFRNSGELQFKNVSKEWGLDHLGVSFGAAFGDLDNDGDLDLVINNFDDFATVARNVGSKGHSIRIRLKGTVSNRWGIGATIRLRAGGKQQASYLSLSRGFMSSSDPTIHFGLGDAKIIDELVIAWPSGRRQSFAELTADRLYTITEPPSVPTDSNAQSEHEPPPLFARTNELRSLRHREEPFDDFAREPLLPFRLSQLGPGLAVGDADGDGSDDIYLGGAYGAWGALVVNSGGAWSEAPSFFAPWTDDTDCKQTGVLLFDADGDDDLDLFAVSGGNKGEPGDAALLDRLYLNDGRGVFSHAAPGQIPDHRDSGSVVAAADYDRDGDLDLFVGSRCIPGRFPETPNSRLLNNNAGTFRDVTSSDGPDLLHAGLVTSALWSDVNADGWIDLLVTCEWGPIRLWINEQGKLRDATKSAGLAELSGWWNGIAGRDLDGDGDIDYVVTNLGRNTMYRVTADRPAMLYYGDFNGDGRAVLVEGKYDEQGRLVPTRSRSGFLRAVTAVDVAFPTFHEFASATLADIVGSKTLESSLVLSANSVDSVVLRNDGKGHLAVESLPLSAQVAPGFGVVLSDFDADGIADAYIVQNSYAPRPEIGRMDGGTSVLLLGQRDGTFLTSPFDHSGLVVPGDAKSVAVTDLNGDNWPDLVVGINDGETLAFVHQKVAKRQIAAVRLHGQPGNPTGVGARVTLRRSDGIEQTAEVQAGGGYLSQQSATQYFGLGHGNDVESIEVRWPDGQLTRQSPSPGKFELLIAQPEAATRKRPVDQNTANDGQ